MSLPNTVPQSGFEESRMTEQQDRPIGEKAKEIVNNAAEKAKDFMQNIKEKVTGDQDERERELPEVDAQGIAEQKQRLDQHLSQLNNAPPSQTATAHNNCACPDCVYQK